MVLVERPPLLLSGVGVGVGVGVAPLVVTVDLMMGIFAMVPPFLRLLERALSIPLALSDPEGLLELMSMSTMTEPSVMERTRMFLELTWAKLAIWLMKLT